MPVPAMQNWPIGGRDAHWQGSDARRRVVDFYTKDGVTDWSKVHKAFFHYEADKAETKTGHNLGYVDVVGGELKAIPHGIFAVAGGHGVTALQSATSEEKSKIKSQVNRWYKRMKKKFPNDDFDFDPPFPEGKSDDNVPEEVKVSRQTLRQEAKNSLDKLKAHLETKFMSPGLGQATSFADLAAIDAVYETINKVFSTVSDFQFLAENVAWNSESPNQMLKTVKSLAEEMVSIFDAMVKEVPESTSEIEDQNENDKGLSKFLWDRHEENTNWVIKQSGHTALLKNSKGEDFFYGRFTNNLWDKEGEVLITEAHQEFVDYLDDHPDQAPELWDWHEEETSKTHKAVWWDFSDGFLHTIWPVTSKEAEGIKAFMAEYDPGMSHGFQVLERKDRDINQIAKYRTFEASILPIEFAANEWTTFEMLGTLKSLSKEERYKMFSPEKERALELLSLGEYKKPLGKASEEDAAAIDNTGAQRKETMPDDLAERGKGTMSQDKEKDQVDDAGAEDTTAETPVDHTSLESLEASVVQGLDLLSAKLEELAKAVAENTKSIQGIKKAKGQSPSVAAWVAANQAKTSVGTSDEGTTDNGEVKDDDPLLGAGPQEEPFEVEGHLLSGL